MTALQVLPPRQLAVLILRDILGFHANEVADMLDSTVDSVNSALKRARASLQRLQPGDREPPPASDSPAEDAIVAKFVQAYESTDLDALVALLTDDVFISMPPGAGVRDVRRSRAPAEPAPPAAGVALRPWTTRRHEQRLAPGSTARRPGLFMVEASQAQRSVMEIPAPGHGFWTAQTIAVSRRYPGIDIGPCVA